MSKMRSYSNLPEEITVDILSRLPAKSAGRCRCVSKPWRSLLSRPKFIRAHLARTTNVGQESLVLLSDYEHFLASASFDNARPVFDQIRTPATKLNFADHPDSWTQIHASCDGLVLAEDDQRGNFLFNPATKEIREVPPSPFGLKPRECIVMYGLGYESVSDDYKIVTVSYYDTDNGYGYDPATDDFITDEFVNVYSLKTNSWKQAESIQYDHAAAGVAPGVFVSGSIHWLACRPVNSAKMAKITTVIVGFDLQEEKFRELPLPSSFDCKKHRRTGLAVLDGCLCLFDEGGGLVWTMKEYGVQEFWTEFAIGIKDVKPLGLLEKEKLILLKSEVRLAMYDLKRGSLKEVVVDGVSGDDIQNEVVSFVESLVSPHGCNETRRE